MPTVSPEIVFRALLVAIISGGQRRSHAWNRKEI